MALAVATVADRDGWYWGALQWHKDFGVFGRCVHKFKDAALVRAHVLKG